MFGVTPDKLDGLFDGLDFANIPNPKQCVSVKGATVQLQKTKKNILAVGHANCLNIMMHANSGNRLKGQLYRYL